MISLIVAVDENNGIGRNGVLPWYCKTDLQHFKEVVKNSTIICGSKTWAGLPETLKRRNKRSIVLSKGRSHGAWHHAETAVEAAIVAKAFGKAYVIGGAQTYDCMLPFAQTVIITRMPVEVDCDTFWKFDNSDFTLFGTQKLPGPIITRKGEVDKNPIVEIWWRK